MKLFSHRIHKQDLKPGDHIYTWRQGFMYTHHGIYIGDGKVIHFIPGPTSPFATSTPRFYNNHSCPNCPANSTSKGVVLTCIDCFMSGGQQKLNLFEYEVTAVYLLAKLRGATCTLATSDQPEDALRRAKTLVESNGFGEYDCKRNSLDFALYCKTGLLVTLKDSESEDDSGGLSGKIGSLLAAAEMLCSMSGLFKETGVKRKILKGLLVCLVDYLHRRLASDIGFRSDVEKVDVEKLLARVRGLVRRTR